MNKKIKKIFVLILAGIMSVALISCTKTAKYTPEESVIAYLDIMVKGDNEQCEKVGIGDLQFNLIKKIKDNQFKAGFNSGQKDETYFDDSQVQKCLNAYNKGVKNIQYKVLSSTINGDTAVVEIEVKPVDLVACSEKTIDKAFSNPSKYINLSETEINAAIIDLMVEELENMQPLDTPKAISVNMKKDKDGYWQISDKEVNSVISSCINI